MKLLLTFIIVLLTTWYVFCNSLCQTMSEKIDTFIENTEYFTEEEYYSLGEIYHYGKYNHKMDLGLAVHHYTNCVRMSSSPDRIGTCYIQLARLYEQANDIELAIHNYLKALEYGQEESILAIGKIYMNGVHPSYLPDKIVAGRLFSEFRNFSPTLKPWCELYLRDIMLNYNDLDAIRQPGVEYKSLDPGIIERIQRVANRLSVIVPYKVANEQTNEQQAEPIANLPKQRILNDRQNVHDHSVQNIGKAILNNLETNDSFEENAREVLKYGDPNVERVVQSLTDYEHSRFGRSEKDVFNSVWTRVKDDNNKRKIFIDNLSSGVEYDTVVCSTGKIMRMLSTFDGVDDSLPDHNW